MSLVIASCAFVSTAKADALDTYVSAVEKTGGWYLTESAVVSGTDVKAGVVYGLYDVPHTQLEVILRDYNRYGELIHFISKSTIIESESQTVKQLRMRAKILKGAIKLKARLKATETRPDNRTVVFELKKQKGNLEALDARFTVRKLSANRSLVRIELLVDPDVWYVRDRKLSQYNQVNARRIARALKKKAGSVSAIPPLVPAKPAKVMRATAEPEAENQAVISPVKEAATKDNASPMVKSTEPAATQPADPPETSE